MVNIKSTHRAQGAAPKTQLQTAKKARPVVAKALLQAMLKQLSAYRGKLVTEQGYQILKTDIERLLAL